MKKITSIALVLVLAITILLLPTSAAKANAPITFNYISTPPQVDGAVKAGEYGTKIHSVDYSKDEFLDAYDKDRSIKADFYAACDKNYLYMAWVVHTEINKFMEPGDYDDKKDGFTEEDLKHMWKYSCVQFIITPGAPKLNTTSYQTGEYSGDYLEVGLAIVAGESRKTAWNYPTAGKGLKPDHWDFVGKRDDKANTTTYEVRIPWNKSGILKAGNGAQFGLTYAIGDQELFNDKDEKTQNMCEWQDGVLGGKKADAGAVITLAGFPDGGQFDVSIDAPVSSAATSSTATSSKATSSANSSSKAASSAASSAAASSKPASTSSAPKADSSTPAAGETEDNSTLIWVIVAAVVLIGGGIAAYIIVAKKKKQ
jgi:hypothetical protein